MTESEKTALPLIEKLIAYRDGIPRFARSDRELLADACNTISSLRATCSDLRTTLSRQAELLGRAAKALEPMRRTAQLFDKVVIGPAYDNPAEKLWDDGQMYLTVGECTTASSTLDAIRDELGGEQG